MRKELDVIEYVNEFPGLAGSVYDRKLIYLDNAATNQVSRHVIEAMTSHLQRENANTHRGIHYLSELATEHFEQARALAAQFINASRPENIVFNSGATAGLNMIARGLEPSLSPADAVLVTRLEHHSNFVPWQQVCQRTGAEFRVVPLTDTGELDRVAFKKLLSDGRVKIASFAAVSNVTGVVNPIRELIAEAKSCGALTSIDGAQAARGGFLDMEDLQCDYCCFSAHKMIGPTGVGVLYGKESALEKLQVRSFGGGMVDDVTLTATELSGLPFRLEPGTPNIVGIAGLKAAIEDLLRFDLKGILAHEKALMEYTESSLRKIQGVEVLGDMVGRFGAISFVVRGHHPYDLASVMDKKGVAVRVGHHCALPHLSHYGQTAVMRISPAFYNSLQDIDRCMRALLEAMHFFEKWGAKHAC